MATKPPSPNPAIDTAIANLMKRLKPKQDGSFDVPEDVAVKIIAQAISWEKVKNHIKDEGGGYHPDNL